MGIFVRAMSVDVSCPTSRYVGDDGILDGSVSAEVENDGDDDVLINWEIEVYDTDGNRVSNSNVMVVSANSIEYLREGAWVTATYTDPGAKTGTCRARVDTEEMSTE